MGSNTLNLLQVLQYIASSSLVTFATQRELNLVVKEEVAIRLPTAVQCIRSLVAILIQC